MMACRKAFDVDLAGFLAEPRAEAFVEFRDHYPRCADCSAEVRAWTQLDAALGDDAHPAPDALAAYPDAAPEARRRIDRHAARCPACREELRLLEAFDPATLAEPVAVSAEPERPSWLEALARLLWHPAFAYGVALLLVAPVVWQLQLPAEQAIVRTLQQPVAVDAALPAEPLLEAAALPPAAERSATRLADAPVQHKAETFAESEPAPAPAAPRAAAPRDVVAEAEAREIAARVARSAPPPPAPRELAAPLRERAKGDVAKQVVAFAAEPSDFARDEVAFLDAQVEEGTAVAFLAPIVLESAPERVALRIPVVPGRERRAQVEVEDAGGERALRESVAIPAGAQAVTLQLPRAWLVAGEYRVSLRETGEPGGERFALTVRER